MTDVRAVDIYRMLLQQCIVEVRETGADNKGRQFVAFVDFAIADGVTFGARAVRQAIQELWADTPETQLPAWDRDWAAIEMSRSLLDALKELQALSQEMRQRLEPLLEDDAVRELSNNLRTMGAEIIR